MTARKTNTTGRPPAGATARRREFAITSSRSLLEIYHLKFRAISDFRRVYSFKCSHRAQHPLLLKSAPIRSATTHTVRRITPPTRGSQHAWGSASGSDYSCIQKASAVIILTTNARKSASPTHRPSSCGTILLYCETDHISSSMGLTSRPGGKY